MAAKDCIGPQCDAHKGQTYNPIRGQYRLGVFAEPETITHEVGKLYHGTGSALEGGVVRPADKRTVYGSEAYAEVGTEKTDALKTATHLAKKSSQEQGTLFGTVYEVEPMSKAEVFTADEKVDYDWQGQTWAKDPVGLKATKAVGFPVNPDVWEVSQAKADDDAAVLKASNNSVV